MTEIWSQTHKKPIKNAHRSARNSSFARGRPPNPPNERGSPPLVLFPLSCHRYSMISTAGSLLNTRRLRCIKLRTVCKGRQLPNLHFQQVSLKGRGSVPPSPPPPPPPPPRQRDYYLYEMVSGRSGRSLATDQATVLI